jgi:hypothetical protein
MNAERKTTWGPLMVTWDLDPEPWDRGDDEPTPTFVFRAFVADPTVAPSMAEAAPSLASLCQIGVMFPTDPYLLAVETELLDEAEAILAARSGAS